MNEMIVYILYILYIVSFLSLLIAYVIARSYIKALEEYIKIQDTENHLLELKTILQDKVIKIYRDEAENRKCSCDVK